MRIAAFDLSLTSTGAAHGPGDHETTVLPTTGLTGAERLIAIRDAVLAVAGRADLVVIEGYAYGRPEKAHALGELGGVVRVALHEAGRTVVVIPPATLKKYACGTGNAKKDLVFGAAIHRAGREFATTDEADAWWLLQMASAHYGLPHVQMPAANRVALDTVDWPELNQEVPA